MMLSQKSGFTSAGLWNILHLLAKIPHVHSAILRALDNLQLYIASILNICWNMAVTHAVIRRTPRHPQTQMAYISLHQWAELWGLECSV